MIFIVKIEKKITRHKIYDAKAASWFQFEQSFLQFGILQFQLTGAIQESVNR